VNVFTSKEATSKEVLPSKADYTDVSPSDVWRVNFFYQMQLLGTKANKGNRKVTSVFQGYMKGYHNMKAKVESVGITDWKISEKEAKTCIGRTINNTFDNLRRLKLHDPVDGEKTTQNKETIKTSLVQSLFDDENEKMNQYYNFDELSASSDLLKTLIEEAKTEATAFADEVLGVTAHIINMHFKDAYVCFKEFEEVY